MTTTTNTLCAYIRATFISSLLLILSACSDTITSESNISSTDDGTATIPYTVAIVVPTSDTECINEWHKMSDWVAENFAKAQAGMDRRVKINVEWFLDNSKDYEYQYYYMEHLADSLAQRSDIAVVVCPANPLHTDILARKLTEARKVVISPFAATDGLIRKYSDKSTFWGLCEANITQCEALLSKAQAYGFTKVSMIGDDTYYGQTFCDWFAFIATEMGMQATGIYPPTSAFEAMTDGSECIICIPDSLDDLKSILKAHREVLSYKGTAPRLFFSDSAFGTNILSLGDDVEGIEGIAPYTDPTTGFEIAFKTRYGVTPTFREVKMYDALLFSSIVLRHYDDLVVKGDTTSNRNSDINGLMTSLMTTGTNSDAEPVAITSNTMGLYKVLTADLGTYNIYGASGSYDYSTTEHSAPMASVYCHWMVYDNKFIPIDYMSGLGSSRVSSLKESWEWKASVTPEIANIGTDIQYDSMESQWAVLVCGSRGWYNYRHTADVLNMYHLLKHKGYDDDHIILIASPDEIAYDERNPYQGIIRTKEGGENVYDDIQLDYNTDTLSASDIYYIMMGLRTAHTPIVLNTDSHSNIFFFWSGHGEVNKFTWGYSGSPYTKVALSSTLTDMHNGGRYRKMLVCTEPCHSASVLAGIEGIDGILGIASAAAQESSFGDNWDAGKQICYSDRFTNNLINKVDANPNISFRQLYLDIVNDTYGSHVTILNYRRFDNLYQATPYEFFVYGNQ